MAYAALKITCGFTTGDDKSFTVQPFAINSSSINYFKANVMQHNATIVDTISDTFVNSAGGNYTGIKAAQITITEDTVIYGTVSTAQLLKNANTED